jgi:phenylpropionate dioxygenase-like ring-hydroxylating dioxygenase large terminal subunit
MTPPFPELDWHEALPLHGWFLVAPSRRLKRGAVTTFDLPGQPIVVFRGEDGLVRAVQAHCPHMGTHLAHSSVHGSSLQCPLHHWRFECGASGSGNGSSTGCAGPGASATLQPRAALRSYAVREACDAIWVAPRSEADPQPFPIFDGVSPGSLLYKQGTPVFLRCPWQAVVANAFDLNHFQTVHARALHGTPAIEDQGHRLEFRYVSKVTGAELADRIMRKVSGNAIDVTIHCWEGSVLTVKTRTQRRETFLWLSFLPVEGGTVVKPVYAVPRGSAPMIARLRVQVAGWLFHAFLKKDIRILERMRFSPKVTPEEDPYLCKYLSFAARQGSGSIPQPHFTQPP